MKKIFLCLCIIALCSGCGTPVSRIAATSLISPTMAMTDVAGRVVWSGVMAGAPNQQSDWADQHGWNNNEWELSR